jgi:hypothetical protein
MELKTSMGTSAPQREIYNTIEQFQSDSPGCFRIGPKPTSSGVSNVVEQQIDSSTFLDQNPESVRTHSNRPGSEPEKKAHSSIVEDIRQTWNGIILESNENQLTVRLEDVSNPQNPDEIAELSIEEIEGRDRALVEPGAMFRWYIGYRYGATTPRERFSKIVIRRLPKWSEEELTAAEAKAKEYIDFFCTDKN